MNGDDLRRRAAAELELRRRERARAAEATAPATPAPTIQPEPTRSRPVEKAIRAYEFVTQAPYDLATGVVSGLSRAGRSWLGLGAGFAGDTRVGGALRRAQEAIEYEPELGPVGKIGQFGGRVAPEVVGAGLAGRTAAAVLPRVVPRIGAPIVAGLQSPSPIVRAGSTAAVSAPFDIAQGYQQEEGFFLPGRAGAIAENIGLSALAGGALPAARRGAEEAADVPQPVQFPRETESAVERYRRITRERGRRPVVPEEPGVPEIPGAPASAVTEAPAAVRAADELDFDAARQRITEPVAPYPADFPVRPRTNDEWREYYYRFTDDPNEVLRLEGQRMAGEIQTRQGTQSIGDNVDAARDIAEKYPDLAFLRADQKLSGPDLLALEMQYNGIRERGKELSKFMDTLDFDDPQLVPLRELRVALERRGTAIFERLSRDRSQSGRDLRLLREAKKNSDNPTDWLYQAESLAGRELSMEQASKLINLVDRGETVEAQKFLGELRRASVWDQAGELYQSGLLTAIMRPVRDVFSSAVNVVDKTAERVIASTFDSMFSRLTGQDRQIAFNLRRFAPELGRAMGRGAKTANAIITGRGGQEALERAAIRYDMSRESIQKNPLLRWYTTAVRRSIGAPDAAMYELGHAAALYEAAEVAARNSDAVKSGTVKVGSQSYQELIDRFLKDPPLEIDAMARDQALEIVFQNETALGTLGSKLGLRNSGNDIARFFGKVILPFVQTPAAITTQTVKGIVAPASGFYNAAKAVNLFRKSPDAIDTIARKMELDELRRKAINDAAKGAVAWSWIGLGYWLADEDKMTGLYPMNDRERRRWELDGRTEASLRLGGKWVSTLGVLGPQAQLMAIGATMRGAINDAKGFLENVLPAVKAAGPATAGVALQTPALQGPQSLLNLVTQYAAGDEDAIKQAGVGVARSYAGGWVPQFVQQIARASDTSPEGAVIQREIRDPDSAIRTTLNAFIQGIPGLRQTLPTRVDMFGETRATTVGGPLGVISPARMSIVRDDPVARELWRTNAAIPRTLRRKNETAEEHRARATALGTYTRQALQEVIASPEYREIARMPVAEMRSQLVEAARIAGVDEGEIRAIESMSDNQVRNRLQGMVLDNVITSVRTNVGRGFPDPSGGSTGRLMRSLTR